MRIVAGRWRGRSLVAPSGREFRPTQGRVREALFSRLMGRVEGAVVVDLFAGSGSLGLEALSRGARSALFVEAAPAALAALRDNIRALGAGDAAEVVAEDVFGFLARRSAAVAGVTLLFADPPYGELPALVAERLAGAPAIDWGSGAVRVIECAPRDADWPTPAGWRRWPQRDAGETRVVIEEREA
jgi:16S rRNA (guanine966-N2)-methyltransferase